MKDFIAGMIVILFVIGIAALVYIGLVPWWAPLLALTCFCVGGVIVAAACFPRRMW